ncbi:MAG: SBBP repeat-containing protein [Acidobacteriia bacterium]|nr:SBBP repeat-containing protein [Terriglobia bacterium]
MKVLSTRFLSVSWCVSMLFFLLLCPSSSGADAASNSAHKEKSALQARLLQSYGKLPLGFDGNKGQADTQVKFLARGRGYSLFLTANEAVLVLRGESQPSKVSSPAVAQRATGHSFLGVTGLPGFPAFPLLGFTTNASALESHSAEGVPNPPLAPHVVRLKLIGANPHAKVVGLDELPGKSNYFTGNDPSEWQTNVPSYARVRCESVYPGIDLVYYGNQRQLEYDLVVAPRADPRAILLEIESAQSGIEKQRSVIRVDLAGDLVIWTDAGDVRLHKPVAYQPLGNSEKQLVAARFAPSGPNRVRFELGNYDPSRTLVIDPVLGYSTYLGGDQVEAGTAIAADSSGNVYVTGMTGPNFPTTQGAFKTSFTGSTCRVESKYFPCPDAFVTKLNATGSAILYSTYLGGSEGDEGTGIAVDAAGNAYITGDTESPDFPTTAGTYETAGGNVHSSVFVAKLNADGSSLVYSSRFGGSKDEAATGIATDASGNAYVTGGTASSDFPVTAGAFQPTRIVGSCPHPNGGFGDCPDAFVTKLNPYGSGLVYSTFLGGSGADAGSSIAVGEAGIAYITGVTSSTDFPTVNPLQLYNSKGSCIGSPASPNCLDAFVAKLNADGSGLVYSTYLGGSNYDAGFAIAADSSGNAYVTGATNSLDFPTTTPVVQQSWGGGLCGGPNDQYDCPDAFVAKLNATGSALVYSTYLGGNEYELGRGIAVDSAGNAYVTGGTNSLDFPTADAIQATFGGGSCTVRFRGNPTTFHCPNAFVAKLNPAGSALVYSTYHGGAGGDLGLGLAIDAFGNAYLTGGTLSADFPTANPLQAHLAGQLDAFVARVGPPFAMAPSSGTSSTAEVAAGSAASYRLTVSPNGFSGTVSLTCAGAPRDATCTLSSYSLNLDGSTPADITVTVTTTKRSLAPPASRLTPPITVNWPAAAWLLSMLILAAGLSLGTARRRAAWALAGMMSLMILCLSCGGGGGGGGAPAPTPQTGTPAGTYTLTVTAAASNFSQDTTLTLKVD